MEIFEAELLSFNMQEASSQFVVDVTALADFHAPFHNLKNIVLRKGLPLLSNHLGRS